MSHQSPTVSVIVPTCNRAALLRACVESLIDQAFPLEQYEVIVADDASTDETTKVVSDLASRTRRPTIRFLSLPRVGGNGARNAGIKAAAGRILCFVDDDEMVQPSHIGTVVEHLERDPMLNGVGGPYRAFGQSRIRTCRRCIPGAADFPGIGKRKVTWLFGGNMALRKVVFEQRGLFDEELSGFQEYEWFCRSPALELTYDPDLWVWHRRDQHTLIQLCRSAWRQGKSFRLVNNKLGRNAAPSILRLLRCAGHGVVRLCGEGLVLACREAGALKGASRSKRTIP